MLHKINTAFLPFAYCSLERFFFLILLSSDQLLSAGFFFLKWHAGKVQNMLLPFIIIHEMTADPFLTKYILYCSELLAVTCLIRNQRKVRCLNITLRRHTGFVFSFIVFFFSFPSYLGWG